MNAYSGRRLLDACRAAGLVARRRGCKEPGSATSKGGTSEHRHHGVGLGVHRLARGRLSVPSRAGLVDRAAGAAHLPGPADEVTGSDALRPSRASATPTDLRGADRRETRLLSPRTASPAVSPATLVGPRQSLARFPSAPPPSATFATLLGLVSDDARRLPRRRRCGQVELGVDAHLNKTLSLYGSGFYDHNLGSGESWSAGGRIGIKAEF